MKTITNTAESLSSLGLSEMAEAYERQLDDPALLGQPFETRLGLMMDAKKSERETRKIERLLKAAKLRETQATLENIEFKASRGLDRNTIMTLGECEWLYSSTHAHIAISRKNNLCDLEVLSMRRVMNAVASPAYYLVDIALIRS